MRFSQYHTTMTCDTGKFMMIGREMGLGCMLRFLAPPWNTSTSMTYWSVAPVCGILNAASCGDALFGVAEV